MTEWTRANVPAKASGEIALTFTQFLHGMADVARHDECKGWLDVNKVSRRLVTRFVRGLLLQLTA